MSNENSLTFEPLSVEQSRQFVDSIETAYELIALTLVDGSILIGGLAKHWKWNGKSVTLGFNSQEGKRFGYSHGVEVPLGLIAGVQTVPLSEESLPIIEADDPMLLFLREAGMSDEGIARLPVQDYPNPLARIIAEHNLEVAKVHELSVHGYIEEALSQDAVPSEGIFLDSDFLLYVDWDHFERVISGGVSVSGGISALVANISVSKDLSSSLEGMVLNQLKTSLVERIRQELSSEAVQDHLIQGRIVVPAETEYTEIEGEKCMLVFCAQGDEADGSEGFPVLLKVGSVKFPVELLGHIKSTLTFHGEMLPIPLNFMNKSHPRVFLARAIAFVDES